MEPPSNPRFSSNNKPFLTPNLDKRKVASKPALGSARQLLFNRSRTAASASTMYSLPTSQP